MFRARVLVGFGFHERQWTPLQFFPMPVQGMHSHETEQVAEAQMESEIKLAWKQGFVEALMLYSNIERERCWKLAEGRWREVVKRGAQLWNQQRIEHRDS